LAITPEEPFFALRTVIQSTAIFAGGEAPRAQGSPHMTVAEFISHEEARSLLAEVGTAGVGGTFLCDHVVYAVPDASFHFEPVLTLALNKSH
jgi:hypothetical protein